MNPTVVDELDDVARISGNGRNRKKKYISCFKSKLVGRRHAESEDKNMKI